MPQIHEQMTALYQQYSFLKHFGAILLLCRTNIYLIAISDIDWNC